MEVRQLVRECIAAIEDGRVSEIREHLSSGSLEPDANELDYPKSPLVCVAAREDQLEILILLVDEFLADVNCLDMNALLCGCDAGSLSIARYLIEEKMFDVNFQSQRTKDTPLHRAVLSENIDLIKYLLSRGSSVTATNEESETPIQLAKESESEGVRELMSEKASTVEAFQSMRLSDFEALRETVDEAKKNLNLVQSRITETTTQESQLRIELRAAEKSHEDKVRELEAQIAEMRRSGEESLREAESKWEQERDALTEVVETHKKERAELARKLVAPRRRGMFASLLSKRSLIQELGGIDLGIDLDDVL